MSVCGGREGRGGGVVRGECGSGVCVGGGRRGRKQGDTLTAAVILLEHGTVGLCCVAEPLTPPFTALRLPTHP